MVSIMAFSRVILLLLLLDNDDDDVVVVELIISSNSLQESSRCWLLACPKDGHLQREAEKRKG